VGFKRTFSEDLSATGTGKSKLYYLKFGMTRGVEQLKLKIDVGA
jgi:hypothetical protein